MYSLYKPFLPSDEDGESAAFTDLTKWLHSFGNIGVDLLFILSGYLIYGRVLKKPQPLSSALLFIWVEKPYSIAPAPRG